MGYWCGNLSGARCRLAYGPADATAFTVCCFSKIEIGFTFLVLADLGSPRKGLLNGCVCVCVICALAKIFSMLYNKGHQQHFSIIAFSSDQVTSTFSSTIKLLHRSLMKLLTSNHAHTKFSLDPTKRVVWANTQFITVRFISLSFFCFSSYHHTHRSTDFYDM